MCISKWDFGIRRIFAMPGSFSYKALCSYTKQVCNFSLCIPLHKHGSFWHCPRGWATHTDKNIKYYPLIKLYRYSNIKQYHLQIKQFTQKFRPHFREWDNNVFLECLHGCNVEPFQFHLLLFHKANHTCFISNETIDHCSNWRIHVEDDFTPNWACSDREVNKNNLLGGQFLIFLPKNPGK